MNVGFSIRELDVAIARSLGCKPADNHVCACPSMLPWAHGEPLGWKGQEVRHYSSDMSAAWKLVELAAKAGFQFSIDSYSGIWRAYFSKPEQDEDEGIMAEADSAPLAICQAFLEVVGT